MPNKWLLVYYNRRDGISTYICSCKDDVIYRKGKLEPDNNTFIAAYELTGRKLTLIRELKESDV